MWDMVSEALVTCAWCSPVENPLKWEYSCRRGVHICAQLTTLLRFILVVCVNSAVRRVFQQRKTKMRYHQVNVRCFRCLCWWKKEKTPKQRTIHLITAWSDALGKVSLFTGKLCGNLITEVPKGEMKNEWGQFSKENGRVLQFTIRLQVNHLH